MFRLDPRQAVLDHVARQSGVKSGELGPEARAIIATPIEPSYSNAVIVGVAQLVEALLLATLGYALYASYVQSGAAAIYLLAILVTTLFANALLNAARTHRVAAYRTGLPQIGRALAAWSVDFTVLLCVGLVLGGGEVVSRV